MNCDDVQELAAELALGIAEGKERGKALEHLAGCPACSRTVQELAGVADALLLLAPAHEPSPDFEVRILDRVGSTAGTRRRRVPRWLIPAGAASLAAATAILATVVFAFQGDRQLASYYRSVLAQAHGQYFQAVALRGPTAGRAGELFVYQGSPSWIFVTVSRPYQMATYRCQLITRQGRAVPMAGVWSQATWGAAIPVPAREISQVRLISTSGSLVLNGTLPRAPA